MPLTKTLALAIVASSSLVAANLRAVTCQEVGGPPGHEVTARIDILTPADGTVLTPTAPCSQDLVVSGTFSVTGPPVLYDFYIVIDASGSTNGDSGSDVDGNGVRGEPADTIYQAEIAAAQSFVRALDASYARVAVIRFNRSATLEQQLTANLAAADATLQAMRLSTPRWGTGYVPAMQAVAAEVLARGDRVNRSQECLFLSDGQPDETLPVVDAEAQALADLGVVIDTFALGFPSSSALQDMATISGGTFTPLVTPGDIVALLPSFVPDIPRTLESHDDLTGGSGTMTLDDESGTFSAVLTLVPGTNHLVFTLTAEGTATVTVECAIDVVLPVGLVADAGPAQAACSGASVLLDGSASLASTCASPRYRWTDCTGAEVCPTSGDPTCSVTAGSGCTDFTLELTCDGEPCSSTASAAITSAPGPLLDPRVLGTCGLSAGFTCGGDPALTSWWDLDADVDADGDGDATNDVDLAGCDGNFVFAADGAHSLIAWIHDDATGCESAAGLLVTLATPIAPRSLSGGLCPGESTDFSCGVPDPGADYWWDFDGAADSDGDGDATNDADALGCDASTSWSSTGPQSVHGWERDAAGCLWMIADGTFDVAPGATPGEASDLRVSHAGSALGFTFAALPGATSYRLSRGTIASLWILRTYDHAADDSVGQGACDTGGALIWDDPDDAAGPDGYYYLVTATNSCGGSEGPSGNAWDGHVFIPRPPRLPSATCP